MRTDLVIERLREKLTSWHDRIFGAAELKAAEDKSRLLMPSAYVMYGGSTAKTLSYETFDQEIDERLRLLVILDNTQDRTGKSAQDQIHTIRAAIFAALLNYRLDEDSHSLQFVGDSMAEMNKAQYMHVFEFKLVGRLQEEDGTPLDLENFNSIYADWNLEESDESDHPDAQDVVDELYTIPE